MKTYLLSYRPVKGGYATNGFAYWIRILKVSWFGLIKEEIDISTLIPFQADLKATLEKYDKLIKDKTPLNLK